MSHDTWKHFLFVLVFLALLSNPISLPDPQDASAAPSTGVTELISVSSSGEQGNDYSREAYISADGRFVAFESSASNLVIGDNNGVSDIFVHDRQSGETELVSVSSDGELGIYKSEIPSISADGRFVAFQSDSNNLVSGDTNWTRYFRIKRLSRTALARFGLGLPAWISMWQR